MFAFFASTSKSTSVLGSLAVAPTRVFDVKPAPRLPEAECLVCPGAEGEQSVCRQVAGQRLYRSTGLHVYCCLSVFKYRFIGLWVYRCTCVHVHNDVQVYRCKGVQVYMCTGVQVFRCTDVQAHMCTQVQVYTYLEPSMKRVSVASRLASHLPPSRRTCGHSQMIRSLLTWFSGRN